MNAKRELKFIVNDEKLAEAILDAGFMRVEDMPCEKLRYELAKRIVQEQEIKRVIRENEIQNRKSKK